MAMATASNSHNSIKSTARLLSSSSIFSSSSSWFVPDRSTMTTTVQWQRLDPPPPSHFGMSRRSGHVAFVVPHNNSNINNNNQKQQQEPLEHRATSHDDDDDDVVLVDDAATPTLSSSSSSSSLYYQPYVFGGYIETDLSQRQEQDDASTTTTNDNDNTNSRVPVVERTVTNDLWMWEYELTSNNNNNNNTDGDVVPSMDRSAWISIPTTGDVPVPRLVAAAVAINSYQVYLLGGWNPAEIDPMKQPILDTVYLLHLNTQSWKQLPIRIPGGPTSRHVAAYIPHRHCILIHNHRCQDYVLLLDPNKVIVDDHHHEDNDNNLNPQDCWIQQPTTGPCPSPRGLHAAVMLNESLLLLFGGAAQDGTMSNQVFILNTQTWVWSELMPLLVEDDDNNNNDNRNHPNDNHNKIKIPSPRAASCLVTTTSSKHDDGDHDDHVIVWLFGGAERTSSGGLRACNDLWSLQLPSLSSLMMMEQQQHDQQQPASSSLSSSSSSSSTSANACPQSSLPSSRLECQWSQILPEDNPLSSSKHHEWPPGRNAATLVPICRTSTTTPRRGGGGVTAAGTMKTTTYSFLLYGGWEPFQRTWDDCYLLHIRSSDGQEEDKEDTQRRQNI